jgi:hypothetical protein
VLIDSSDSVLQHFRQGMADILQLIAQLPWGAEDNISVLSFGNTEVRSICSGESSLLHPRGGCLPAQRRSDPVF